MRTPQERDTEAKVAKGKVANPEPSSSSLQKDISTSEHSIQPTTKDALSPRSPTPTMKTDSVDTDSASISANTSPAPSSSNPSPPPHQAAILNPQLQVALKLLVSNSASGYIIGRSGKTISDLQTKSLARIKLSQGGDYYPGTTDRVCLIQGMLSNVSVALQMVLTKLHELHSNQRVPTPTKTKTYSVGNSSSPPEDESSSTPFVVKILIPSSCCGMMIGLGGSNIKALKDKSAGVTHIQFSPKDDEVRPIGGGMSTLPTSERIMTIAGSSYTSCLTCIQLILNDMAINPEIARYLNMTTSYSRNIVTTSPMVPSAYVAAPTAAASGIHSPYQYPPVVHRPEQYQPSSPPRSAQNMSLLSQELMHHQGDVSALSDPSSQSSQPSQGMMPVTPPRVSDLNQNPSSFPQYQPGGPPTQYWSPSSRRMSSSSGHNISPVVDQLSHNFQAQASIQRQYQSSSSLQEMTPQQLVTVQLGVADTRIGSILGHGGKKLTEIQSLSRTKIRISQRGDFIPNTQNRIVTITGSTAQDVEHAQQLIIKRLAGGDLRASFS